MLLMSMVCACDKTPPTDPAEPPEVRRETPAEMPAEPPVEIVVQPTQIDPDPPSIIAINAIESGVEGGWAEAYIGEENRIVVLHENVESFTLRLEPVQINWDKRVVLKINDDVMQLTRKPSPIITFVRSPGGIWEVIN